MILPENNFEFWQKELSKILCDFGPASCTNELVDNVQWIVDWNVDTNRRNNEQWIAMYFINFSSDEILNVLFTIVPPFRDCKWRNITIKADESQQYRFLSRGSFVHLKEGQFPSGHTCPMDRFVTATIPA